MKYCLLLLLSSPASAAITGIVTLPGGTTGQMQYNNNGIFSGADMTVGFNGGIRVSTPLYLGQGGAINVKAYGAKGDGATSDTAAIMAAMAVLPSTGGVLYFPAGHKYLVSSISISSLVTLSGDAGACSQPNDGRVLCGSVIMSTTTTAPIIKYTVDGGNYSITSRNRHWVALKDITLIGSSTVNGNSQGIFTNLNGQHCLQIDNNGAKIHNVTMFRCGGNGLYLTSSTGGTYDNLNISGCNGDGILLDNSHSPLLTSTNLNYFHNLNIDSNGRSAFRINREGQGQQVWGLNCDSNVAYCIDINAVGYGAGGTTQFTSFGRFWGVWGENNGSGDLHIGTAATSNKFEFIHNGSSNTFDVNYGLNHVSGSSTTGPSNIDFAMYDTMGNIRSGGGFDSSDSDHLHIRSFSGLDDGQIVADGFLSSKGLADNRRYPLANLFGDGAFNVANGQGMKSSKGGGTVAYNLIFGDSDNGVSLGDASTGTVKSLPQGFTVGTSSFVVAGGSATVAYRMTAGSFSGDGSGLTGVGGTFNGGTVSSHTTFQSSVTIQSGQFSVGATTFVVTNSSVGIRTATPLAALDVRGSAAFGLTTQSTFSNAGNLVIGATSGVGLQNANTSTSLAGHLISLNETRWTANSTTTFNGPINLSTSGSAATTGRLAITVDRSNRTNINGSTGTFTFNVNGTSGFGGNITLLKTADRTIAVENRAAADNAAGNSLTVRGGNANSASNDFNGGNVTIEGGNGIGAGIGADTGGSVYLHPGNGSLTTGWVALGHNGTAPRGNVGVGNNAPGYLLDVGDGSTTSGDMRINAPSGNPVNIYFSTGGAQQWNLQVGSNNMYFVDAHNGIPLFLGVGPGGSVAGKVGINTLTPSTSLDVNGSLVVRSTLAVQGDAFSVGGTSLSVSGGSAYVSVSTADAAQWITIQGAGTKNIFLGNGETANNSTNIVMTSSRTAADGRLGSLWQYYGKTPAARIDFNKNGNDVNSGAIGFVTYNAGVSGSRMVITSTGTVGIGTSFPSTLIHMSSGTLTIDGTSPAIVVGTVTISGTAPPNGQALCLTSGRLGYCTSVVGATGGCTCAAP